MRPMKASVPVVALLFAALAPLVTAQEAVTSPEQQFGHEIGADYQLPNYTQLYEYWQKLASESDRMSVHDIGPHLRGEASDHGDHHVAGESSEPRPLP